MVSKTVTVVNEQGFHMRPAGILSKAMGAFQSNVTLEYNGKVIKTKSVMMILSACIKCNAQVTIRCEGPDEEAALAKAVELIESGFGE